MFGTLGSGAKETKALLKLLVTQGSALGAEIKVEHELEIGREAEGDGRLAGDAEISRRHARITRQDDGSYVIEDLGSTNGTLVNGTAIAAPSTLKAGDTLAVGGTSLLVEEAATKADKAATGVRAVVEPAETVSPPEAGAPTEDRPAAAGAGPVQIALQIEIDVERGSATVRLDDGPGSAVELEHRDGVWRLAGGG